MVSRNVEKSRLHFSTNLAEAITDCDVAFIAVGTPPGEDGSADLKTCWPWPVALAST